MGPLELQEAKALTKPRYRGKVSDSTPLKGNVYLAIACHGPRITHNQPAPLELLVSLVRQLFTASQKRRCKKIIMDGELIKETFNLGRKQIAIILSALWNELERMGSNHIKCEVYFKHSEAGDSTSREVTLRWPLFIQIGPTAEKIGEVTSTIQPEGVLWKDLQAHIQHNTAQHTTAQHSTTQHSTTQHNTTQHSTTQHTTAH